MSTPTEESLAILRQTLTGLIGYTCETQAPNSKPTTEFITDRWMQPVLDRLVEYFVYQCEMAETEGAIRQLLHTRERS